MPRELQERGTPVVLQDEVPHTARRILCWSDEPTDVLALSQTAVNSTERKPFTVVAPHDLLVIVSAEEGRFDHKRTKVTGERFDVEVACLLVVVVVVITDVIEAVQDMFDPAD